MSTREKMLLSKAVSTGWGNCGINPDFDQQAVAIDIQMVAASFLVAVFSVVSAIPRPGVIRERHIIHAPIKYKIIHHYNIKKVPILIKKHLHYYKPEEGNHHNLKPILDETHDNQIYQQYSEGHQDHYEHPQVSFPHEQEEDYEESEHSQEENEEYEDYEYE